MKQITISESKVEEAMSQIDALVDLPLKNKGCLRLLTEEMFSMINELLHTDTVDFELERNDNTFKIKAITKSHIDDEAKKQLISINSSGKNSADKEFNGLIGAVIELLSYETPITDSYNTTNMYGMSSSDINYSCVWSLNSYIQQAPKEDLRQVWDGMEKSVIANFADDISIGVLTDKLEMIVTKTFN